jgi:hypothetical protein
LMIFSRLIPVIMPGLMVIAGSFFLSRVRKDKELGEKNKITNAKNLNNLGKV